MQAEKGRRTGGNMRRLASDLMNGVVLLALTLPGPVGSSQEMAQVSPSAAVIESRQSRAEASSVGGLLDADLSFTADASRTTASDGAGRSQPMVASRELPARISEPTFSLQPRPLVARPETNAAASAASSMVDAFVPRIVRQRPKQVTLSIDAPPAKKSPATGAKKLVAKKGAKLAPKAHKQAVASREAR
jgi:hypothetical protein